MSDDNFKTSTSRIPADKLAEFFHARKSKARVRLVDAMYRSQGDGFTVYQRKYTRSQVSFVWTREVDVPKWAVDRGLCRAGSMMRQSVKLCFTNTVRLSILLRVYRGHCYGQTDWQHVSMRRAIEVLGSPVSLLEG